MHGSENISALLALAAGFLSFVSPCVFPLVPSYMVFITGLSFDQLEHEDAAVRRIAVRHSLAFVGGFGLVFVLLGASATALGGFILENQLLLMRIGGVVVALFGLYVAGVFHAAALEKERRIHLAHKPHGLLGSALVGITFALGWTPCIGPILGSILVLASTTGSIFTGIYLLSAYAIGLGIPFLIAGIAFPWFLARMKRINRHLQTLSRISGALLVVIGVAMMTNVFAKFSAYLTQALPLIDLERYLPR